MPRVKIDYIVSFSSEDPEHPASNLLSWEVGKRRWLCPAGESSCSVVLQLSHAVQISAIHIGTYHAAVIEVLIGRSEVPDAFEVLVPSSVFLTPSESRKDPQDRVRSFSESQLTSTQRGDRLRVVCRQPYNKQCKYGLSFIHVFEPENGSSSAPPPKVASPVPLQASRAIAASSTLGHSSSDEEDYRPGQLFAATRTTAGTSTDTGSQIRKATSQILKNISDTPTKIVKSPIVKNTSSSSKQNVTEPSTNRYRNSLMYTDDEEKFHSKIDSVVQKRNDEKAKERDAKEAKEKLLKEKKDRENVKQSEFESKKDKHDDRSKKDDHRVSSNDLNTSQHNKGKNNNHNASRTDSITKDDTPRRDNNNLGHRNKHDKANPDNRSRDDQNRHNNDSSATPGTRNDSDSRNKDKTASHMKGDNRNQDRKAGVKRARTSNDSGDLQAGPVSPTPQTLLSNCALVLSGYVHPRRGQIRAAAAALGATVLHDWGPRATHLICAFPNTPKLRQALASNPATPIATGEWVEKCCELRRLLPWQWFATEPGKRVPMPDLSTLPDGDDGQSPRDEEGDTDDEIEKVLREQKKRRRSNTPEAEVGNTDQKERRRNNTPKAQVDNTGQKERRRSNTPEAQVGNIDQKDDSTDDVEFVRDERIKGRLTVHDSDSDEDNKVDGDDDNTVDGDDDNTVDGDDDDREENKSVTQTNKESDADTTDPKPPNSTPGRAHSPLPNFFDGCTFYIAPDVGEVGFDDKLLKRYVRAYGGVLVEEWSAEDDPVDYVLCAVPGCGVRGRCVRADWLWRCHAERRLARTDRYLV